jgi:endonuclease/exonuclease/phosphatase (EEP) superfamily protein YafD
MLNVKSLLVTVKIFNLFILTAAVVITTVFTVCSLFDKHSFWFNLCAQFKWQYLWVQLITICLLLIYKYWKTTALVAVAAVLNLVPILLLYVPEDLRQTAHTNERKFTLLQLNAYFRNASYDSILTYCQKVNPDVILIEELTPELALFLERGLGDYAYRKIQRSWSCSWQ